eukprot:maker-scaffold1615_size33485-snap-gene-0.12 protein:Tk10390 transcript:maker-scaffold1615_size33485-snap-gene-0.12-mRNA-1 annotation:"hypothetical protein CGLO_02976"
MNRNARDGTKTPDSHPHPRADGPLHSIGTEPTSPGNPLPLSDSNKDLALFDANLRSWMTEHWEDEHFFDNLQTKLGDRSRYKRSPGVLLHRTPRVKASTVGSPQSSIGERVGVSGLGSQVARHIVGSRSNWTCPMCHNRVASRFRFCRQCSFQRDLCQPYSESPRRRPRIRRTQRGRMDPGGSNSKSQPAERVKESLDHGEISTDYHPCQTSTRSACSRGNSNLTSPEIIHLHDPERNDESDQTVNISWSLANTDVPSTSLDRDYDDEVSECEVVLLDEEGNQSVESASSDQLRKSPRRKRPTGNDTKSDETLQAYLVIAIESDEDSQEDHCPPIAVPTLVQ